MLGFRNRGTRANAVNRYRVRAALRSRHSSRSVLVLCGGSVAGSVPEADLMARYARRERRYRGPLVLERESRTTEENLRNAAALLEESDTVVLVSNSLHAERARRLLRTLRPDLADRLVRAEEHRFGEIPLQKLVASVLEAARTARGALPR